MLENTSASMSVSSRKGRHLLNLIWTIKKVLGHLNLSPNLLYIWQKKGSIDNEIINFY